MLRLGRYTTDLLVRFSLFTMLNYKQSLYRINKIACLPYFTFIFNYYLYFITYYKGGQTLYFKPYPYLLIIRTFIYVKPYTSSVVRTLSYITPLFTLSSLSLLLLFKIVITLII